MEVDLRQQEKRYCLHCSNIRAVTDGCIVRHWSEKPVFLVLKEGKYGKFWGCPNFPKCNYSESVPKEKSIYYIDGMADFEYQS